MKMKMNDAVQLEKTYLFSRMNNVIQPIRILPDEDVKMIKQAINELFEFQFFYRKMLEINLNYTEYQKTVQKHSKIFVETSNIKYLMNEIFVDINRTFLNFSSSLKMFVEKIEKQIRKRYGSQSAQYKLFKTMNNSIYDNYFSFRLIINMRDFGIHNKYPIDSFFVEKNRYKNSDKFQEKLNIDFDRDALLSDDRVNRKLGEELRKKYNKLFPIEPVMLEILKPLKIIFETYIKIEKDKFVHQAEIIEQFVKENKYGGITTYGNIRILSKNPLRFDYNSFILPVDIIDQLKKEILNSEKK